MASMKNIAASIEARAAARAEDCGAWARSGDKSPAHHLARITGTTVGAAMEAVDTARMLDELPEVRAAAEAGRLSAQQAEAIASAASADPSAEKQLVADATRLSLKELRDEADKIKAAADPDLEARRKRLHKARSLRTYTDGQGAGNLHMRDNPERVARVRAVLDDLADDLFEVARKEGRHESPGAYLADALVAAVCGEPGEAAGVPRNTTPKIIVRADLDALLRGVVADGEVCELVGWGPMPVSTVEEMIASGALLCAVATKGCDVASVVHLGRRPTALMTTALQWLYPTCAVQGCGQVARLQKDHRDDWARTKVTMLGGLDLLCAYHHGLKTTKNWALVEGKGKRAFVAPEDPRHPNRAHAPPQVA